MPAAVQRNARTAGRVGRCPASTASVRPVAGRPQAGVKDRTAALNCQKTLRVALLGRRAARRLTQIAAQIKAIDDVALASTQGDPDLDRRRTILESIRGFGDATAIALLADMSERGTLDEKPGAALAGPAPMIRQSGRWNGKSKIQGGRGHVRPTLSMPATVAARFNADMKAQLEAQQRAGKPANVATTAVMRRLVILARASCATSGFGRRSLTDQDGDPGKPEPAGWGPPRNAMKPLWPMTDGMPGKFPARGHS